MELFIIGGILVALMVLVSTKIKSRAAQAFEREVIETNDFRLIKPDGFLHPLRDESAYAFEAYSKELGEKDERNVWKGQIYLTVSNGLNFYSECRKIKKEDGKLLSEKMIKDTAEGEKHCLFEKETSTEDAAFLEFRKVIESRKQQKTYDLKITILKSFKNEYVGKVDEFMSSFELK